MVRYGGSLSGEHGDGQARGELLARMYSPEIIEAFREFKAIWDPGLEDESRQGRGPLPRRRESARGHGLSTCAHVKTHFQFPDDHHSFASATRSLRRRRRLPASRKRRRHDVPELHGDPRREALHARAGAPAERDDSRRGGQGRLARAKRFARRSTCACRAKGASTTARCRWTWRRTRRSSSRTTTRAAAAALRLRVGADLLVGARRRHDARDGELLHADAGLAQPGQARRRLLAEAPHPAVRSGDVQAMVRAPGHPQRGQAPGHVVGRYVQQSLHTRGGEGRGRGARARGLQVRVPARSLCCGRPLYDYGMLDTAEASAPRNPRLRCASRSVRGFCCRTGAELHDGVSRRTAEPAVLATRTPSGSPGRASC